MSLFYSAVRVVAIPILRTGWRLRVSGMAENLPADGPVIFAANHLSVSDHLFLPAVCSRKVYFMTKAEYFTGRGLKGRITAAFMKGVGQVPVDRTGGDAAMNGLSKAAEVLRDGRVFGIFPEGTRSPDGRLYRGRTGVARLALETGAPVLPVGLVGTDRAQPKGNRFPHPGHEVTVRVGPALDFSRFAGRGQDREAAREMTDEIMLRIADLSGQTMVPEYAPRRIAGGSGGPGEH